MTRIVWLNGEFLPEEEAKLPIFDRGLLFADAVYEGLGILDGKLLDFDNHMARLRRSLGELSIAEPMDQRGFHTALTELIRRNGAREGFLYLHITRGAHERDYLYPGNLTPNMFAFIQESHGLGADQPPKPMNLASAPDIRWARRDIKTSNLLGQVLAKQIAHEAGADEALMVDNEGYVTEAGAMSFFMIKSGTLYVRPLTREILPGVTRKTMLQVAEKMKIPVSEQKYRLEEVFDADEAFLTGASSYIEPVGLIDGKPIGNGGPGPFTLELRTAYLKSVRESAC